MNDLLTISNKIYSASNVIISEDKFISQIALIIASQTVGKTVIKGIMQCDDTHITIKALKLMGVKIIKEGASYIVYGVGVGGLVAPKNILDIGGSDISAQLLIGLVSTYSFISFFAGEIDLCSKPMLELTKALSSMCVNFITNNNQLPVAVIGSDSTIPISYTLPISSAEIKSAILFAALNTAGTTTIIELQPAENHTEIMLQKFGANLTITQDKSNGSNIIILHGREELFALKHKNLIHNNQKMSDLPFMTIN